MNALISHWPSLLLLALSAVPASYMHVHDHGKLPRRGRADGFFGWNQQVRKYKWVGDFNTGEPAFWGSETFLIMFVDAYHASQALMRILMSLSVTLAMNAPWWAVITIWWTYAGIHALFYKLLSR
jgi:hypothetical protein